LRQELRRDELADGVLRCLLAASGERVCVLQSDDLRQEEGDVVDACSEDVNCQVGGLVEFKGQLEDQHHQVGRDPNRMYREIFVPCFVSFLAPFSRLYVFHHLVSLVKTGLGFSKRGVSPGDGRLTGDFGCIFH